MTPAEKRRKAENDHILKAMQNGESLCHTDLSAYRWAPRPTVKKDQKEIARLYGTDKKES